MVSRSPILLDTCILNNLLSKEKSLASQTLELLYKLSKEENTFYFSEFTQYELLRCAMEEKKKEIKECLDNFTFIPHSKERLERSTRLYEAYAKEPLTKNILSGVSDCDIFIGSLIFTKNKPLLLTADYSDFPRPLFIEKDIHAIEFTKKGNKKTCLYYYLLQANLETLS